MNSEERERRSLTVVDSFEGIIPCFEAFYLNSILYSAGRCLEAFARYEQLKEKNLEQVDADYLISIVQEAIGHAAALSRYFWPSLGGKRTEPNQKTLKDCRGIKLRQAFCLNDSSPLYNRDLRNAWEHFDERLDTYLLENDAGMFFPECKIDSHSMADDPIGHIFKLLDPQEECLVLMGSKYFFAPIRNEVKKVFDQSCTLYNGTGRL
jgi:hypothetical protein